MDEDLRWGAIDLFADNGFEESGIEDHVEVLLALCTLCYDGREYDVDDDSTWKMRCTVL